MSTIQRQILDAVVQRLQASPAIVSKPTERIRISHRTPVLRENAPAIYVVPSEDEVGTAKDCDRRTVRFDVALLARDDGGVETLDALMVAVFARLKPARDHAIPYPAALTSLTYGRIRFDEEIADEDVAGVLMSFEARYSTESWSLEG